MNPFLRSAACVLVFTFMLTGCEELFVEEDPEPPPAQTGSYNYSFTCSTGRTNTVPIPNRLSNFCRGEWEFYARTYGCNDADRFAEAERRRAACP